VFLFDLPTDLCIQGATERLGKSRYDLPWVENELTPAFKQSIEEFPHSSLPRIYDLLEAYGEDRQIIVFKSREAADAYLRSVG
jgi:hypothetical protein